jgi:hypothetical protein
MDESSLAVSATTHHSTTHYAIEIIRKKTAFAMAFGNA